MGKTAITERAMQAAPEAKDIWLIDPSARGDGQFVGRITPSGARLFYYRYTHDGDRVRLPIGAFHPQGDNKASFTVKQARSRADAFTALYRAGMRDLRGYFVQKQADDKQREQDKRDARAAERRQREEAEKAAREAAALRIDVRKLFDHWQAGALQPHIDTNGERRGRKDGGQWVKEMFER